MTGSGAWIAGRGVPLGRRMVAHQRARFAITIAGIGVAVVLVLFLIALYEGVRVEANGYVASRPVDAWVAQDSTTNFIKSTSLLPAGEGDLLAEVDGVAEVTPLLRVITTAVANDARFTVILLGIDPRSDAGRPEVVQGSATPANGEIVLDLALARQHHVSPGDTIVVQQHPFRVIGLSRGTNSVLTQFAVVTFEDAQLLLGVPDMTSFFLVRGRPGLTPDALVRRLSGQVPRTAVFTEAEFAANNMHELRGGLLPILATVAVLGGIVALAVLTLLLYGAILEQRETYAVLKAIGASSGALGRVVVVQALAAALGGLAFGVVAYAACAPLVERLVPAMALSLPLPAIAWVGLAVSVMGVAGAVVPLRRVGRIHPAELFRA
ncbi:MAG: ABC transporter permease [Vicinamibacterales bacterium]